MRARRKDRDDVTATILASIALMFGGMALLTIGTVGCSSGTDARPECRTHQIALGSGESVASRLIMCCSSARKLQLEYVRHSGPPVTLLPSTNPKRGMPGR